MKKIYFSLIFSVFLSLVFSTSFSQTITLGSLGTTSFCPSGTLAVPFTTDLPVGTVFRVYLSSSSGSFTPQTQIGSGTTSPINITFPATLLFSGTGYRIKVQAILNGVTTSSISSPLSTTNKQLSISVKNLMGKEIPDNFFMLCEGSAITGIINPGVSNQTFKWEKDGVLQSTNQSLRIKEIGNYVATAQQLGCNSVSKTTFFYFNTGVFSDIERNGAEYQCIGGSIIFRNQYFTDSTTYQWKRDGNILANEYKDTLVAFQTGIYTVEAFDKCPVNTRQINNKVVFGNSIENTISSFGLLQTKVCGSGITVHLGSNGSPNPQNLYTYQWRKNGVNIPNKNASQLFPISEEGNYSLVRTQGNCTSISNGILVDRVDTLKLNFKIISPYTNEICNGMKTQLQEYSVGDFIQKKIYKDGILYKNGNGFADITETGIYTVQGSATGCVILPSDPISVTVNNTIKSFISAGNRSICLNETTSLNIFYYSLSGLNNPQFQWYKNNQMISGETSTALNVSESGSYKLLISAGICTGFSDTVVISAARILPKLKIYDEYGKVLNSAISLCTGNVTKIYPKNNNIYGHELDKDSLFLKKNGNIILKRFKADEPFFADQTGSYTFVRKQGTCETESDPVEIKIGEPITANITGTTSIYPGQKAKLNLNFTGGNAWSYQISDVATGQTTSLSPTLKNVSPTMTQTYSITSVASNCGVGTITGNATVTVLPCPTDKTISLNSGNWNTSTTWTCGQIPTAAYDAIIENGHTVTLPNGYQGVTKKLDLKGGLKQGVGSGVRVN
jgi:trimeric autotransporter adhesin